MTPEQLKNFNEKKVELLRNVRANELPESDEPVQGNWKFDDETPESYKFELPMDKMVRLGNAHNLKLLRDCCDLQSRMIRELVRAVEGPRRSYTRKTRRLSRRPIYPVLRRGVSWITRYAGLRKMATTKPHRIGRTRYKLAQTLQRYLQEKLNRTWFVRPEDLNSNFARYATVQMDGCSWDGYARNTCSNRILHVYSYDTMRECVKKGITHVGYGEITLGVFYVEITCAEGR